MNAFENAQKQLLNSIKAANIKHLSNLIYPTGILFNSPSKTFKQNDLQFHSMYAIRILYQL